MIRFNRKLLIGAAEMTIHEVVDLIHRLNGVAVASHVDRQGFGIIGQLGFIPADLHLDALEITDRSREAESANRAGISGCRLFGRPFPGRRRKGTHIVSSGEDHRRRAEKSLRSQDGRRIIA